MISVLNRDPDCSYKGLYRLSESWRIRNDNCNVVAYKCTNEKDVFFVLSVLEASLLPMFDGNSSMADIRVSFLNVFKPYVANDVDLDQKFREISSQMIGKGLLTLEGDSSPSLEGDRSRLIPSFADYSFPAWRLERPLSVTIAFTNRCLCNCIYCYAERRECPEADLSHWIKIFDELYQNDIYLVDIGGGDLLARIDAFDILEEMTSRDFVFLLSTKGNLSRDDAERLASLNIGRKDAPAYLYRPIQISIDSVDKFTASTLVGRENYFSHASQTIKNLLDAGLSPRIKSVLTSANSGAPEELVRYFADLGVTDFQFAQYGRSKYRHDDSLFLSLEQKQRLSGLSLAVPGTEDIYTAEHIYGRHEKHDLGPLAQPGHLLRRPFQPSHTAKWRCDSLRSDASY
jgi:MoaA/NifB/PqqE/SkfB family radical SAM enzyme